jgi:hypothetical protein
MFDISDFDDAFSKRNTPDGYLILKMETVQRMPHEQLNNLNLHITSINIT